MLLRFHLNSCAVCLMTFLAIGDAAATQPASADVTFVVPLNLTNLAGNILKVRVNCLIASANLPSTGKGGWSAESNDIAVSAGQVVTTANVIVVVPASSLDLSLSTRTAQYQCTLHGYSAGGAGWHPFSTVAGAKHSSDPSLWLTPEPDPIAGSFQW